MIRRLVKAEGKEWFMGRCISKHIPDIEQMISALNKDTSPSSTKWGDGGELSRIMKAAGSRLLKSSWGIWEIILQWPWARQSTSLGYATSPIVQTPISEPLSLYFLPHSRKILFASLKVSNKYHHLNAGPLQVLIFLPINLLLLVFHQHGMNSWPSNLNGITTSIFISSISSWKMAFLRHMCMQRSCMATDWPGGSCPPQACPHKPLPAHFSCHLISVQFHHYLESNLGTKIGVGFPTPEIKCRSEENRTWRGRQLCLCVLTVCSVLSQTLINVEMLTVVYLCTSPYLGSPSFSLPESCTKLTSWEWRWGCEIQHTVREDMEEGKP